MDDQLNPDAEHPDLGLPCYGEVEVDTSGFDRGMLNLSAFTRWTLPSRRPTARANPGHARKH